MTRITDSHLKKLNADDGEQIVSVDTCLFLRVAKSHHGHVKKTWFLRFRNDGKIKRFVFGTYPEIGLADAKAKAIELLKRARSGENLVETKRLEKEGQAETFREIAEKWLETRNWLPAHRKRQTQRLESNALRVFGHKPVDSITIDDIDTVISRLVQNGSLENAYRNLVLIRGILKYADALDKLGNARIIGKLEAYMYSVPRSKNKKHFYRELSEAEIGVLLNSIDSYVTKCRIETSVALRVIPYLLCRPMELCGALWGEIDFESAEWRIPPERMKMSREHIVPLPKQAVGLFMELHKFTYQSEYCFPSWSKNKEMKHINSASLIMALRRMGYVSTVSNAGVPFTSHGFRGMGATILYQTLNYPGHLIELQLAHVDSNKVRAAYNQITARSWLDERREMLQKYADYLDGLKQRAN